MSQRRVLVLHRGGSQIRGSEEVLLRLFDEVPRDRLDVSVLCSDPALGVALDARHIPWRQLDFPEVMVSPWEQRVPALAYARAVRSVVAAGRLAGADAVICSGGGPCQLGVPAAGILGVPTVGLFHHPAPRNYHRFWLTRHVTRMIYTSRFAAEHSRAQGGPDGVVLYCGLDTESQYPDVARDSSVRAALGVDADALVFAQVGALVPHKGHDVLIAAFDGAARVLPKARLLIIGAGPRLAHLKELVSNRGLEDRVTFAGYVPDTRVYFQQVIDVNVLASHEEGFGLVNLEASACKVPNLATNGTGIRETIIDGKTGFLFADGDVNALSERMIELGSSEALRQAMGANGRRMVETEFSLADFGTGVEKVLAEAIETRQAPR